MGRSGWQNKSQQRTIESIQSTVKHAVQVGRMEPVPVSQLSAKSDLKTRGAQISFSVLSLQGVDSFVLVRNFSRDSGSAVQISMWSALSLKTTPQTFPLNLHYADADPAIAGKIAYYWIKAVPSSNATSSNVFLSDPQKFDASQQPSALQQTGDYPISQAYTPTTQPLTAVTGVGVNQATINVAGFQIQYPFDANNDGAADLVSYNSGVLTPLLDATLYFVYFNDPTYVGGPQTYIASVNNPDLTAGLFRQYIGNITTPAHGAGGTSGSGGGGGVGGPPCFTGNTRIKMQDGAKPIEEIKIGDMVESLAGWVKVTATLKHWYEGPMQAMGFGEFVTPDHRMWADRGWVPAKELYPDSVPFKGWVFNLHCQGKDDFERCYRLKNGSMAHNARKV